MAENKGKSETAEREEKILAFWEKEDIFQKTVDKEAPAGDYVFYDGPPFATGLPHYGHILASTIKDVIPRYRTMRGYRVRRRWGWDCHGLPLENVVEQDLGLKTKKDILDLGIGKFNETARNTVLRFADEWRHMVPRLGRFVDMEDDYKTMDASYTESVWWIFKTLYDKDLIYEGYKSMQLCPRCETTLSNFEVNQGYKDIVDLSVTVKFELVDEPGTYLLAWTTTPWTLPGNVALAVNPAVEYSLVLFEGKKYWLATPRVSEVFKDKEYQVEKTLTGQQLIGQKYHSLFDYYTKDESLKNKTNGWQIYGAEFVTTEDGTGVVHIAPAFGEDDMLLGQKCDLPFIQHVGTDGRFKPEVSDFAGELVKPKDDHQATDVKIIKYLAGKDLLFAKQKITHSYPHCWRCETPLLNYAASSWFVKVTAFKDKLVEANQSVTWVPEHIRDGRFGKWLEGARDWAISRSRFWGAPIPVWRCRECKKVEVLGSLAELKSKVAPPKNTYIAIRHGEAESNVANRISSRVGNPDGLTAAGREEVMAVAAQLKADAPTLIISSDFTRAKETANLIAETVGIDPSQIIYDERLRELDAGELEGHSWQDYGDFFKFGKNRLTDRLPGGESMLDVRWRVLSLLAELEQKYQDQTIVLVSHGLPIFTLIAGAAGAYDEKIAETKLALGKIHRATRYLIEYYQLPRNASGSLDLHRPYIDEVALKCACGGKMERVPEVFDCWFESGSMPYGQAHYPFAADRSFDPATGSGFPAQFIAEGLDQTRGWFYSLLVLGVALFGVAPYRHVIVNGLILAEDGQKMSKKLKNYPDPANLINKYGADVLRWYLLQGPVVAGEDLNFSEAGVGEVSRRVFGRLGNVYQFYQLYRGSEEANSTPHVLDDWIWARLAETVKAVSFSLERYELDRALRPLDAFIDDLSNWYLRRSRERAGALVVLPQVLKETAKLMAPFAPFTAEWLYRELRFDNEPISVHLADWPAVEIKSESYNVELLANMAKARQIVEQALALRQQAGVKVRQPLGRLTINIDLPKELQQIIADEVNVKNIVVDTTLPQIDLDQNLTPELMTEGEMREFTRQVQEWRKVQGYTPQDLITLTVHTDKAGQSLIKQFESEIKKIIRAREIVFADNVGDVGATTVKTSNHTFTIYVASPLRD